MLFEPWCNSRLARSGRHSQKHSNDGENKEKVRTDWYPGAQSKDKYLKRVGADVKNKVVLPYYMGSQNKIKDSEEEITKYQAKYPGLYTISDKLDGVSCLIVYTPGQIKMYTRGNGTEGQDISHLMGYVKEILPAKNENDMAINSRSWLGQ